MKLAIALALPLLCSLPALAGESSKDYELKVNHPSSVTAGQDTAYAITIVPKGEWKLKDTTPFKVILHTSDGVRPKQIKFNAKDFKDGEGSARGIETTFIAPSGHHFIEAEMAFFLCTAEICQRFTAKPHSAFSAK